MTRSSVTPPQSGAADRYDVESFPSDDFVEMVGDGSENADRRGENGPTTDVAPSHPRAALLDAAKRLLEHLNDGNEDFLDVDGVADFLRLPRTAAHCILDILEVFQVIIPRGSMYSWRGTTHVALLLQSDKFKAGASMQTGIAVPRVCCAMIPHLRENVGVEFTVDTMAKWLWEAQDSTETIATIAEARWQQLRALSAIIADVLAVIEALGLIDFAACPKRGAVYLFNPHSKSELISPKGMQQSTRMRNMRVMFDGPAPTHDPRPGTSASHRSNRSNPRSMGAPARPYTAAPMAAAIPRGRARPPHTPPQPFNASPADSSDHSLPRARTSRTPPPPTAYARQTIAQARNARGIYAARAPVALPLAPLSQPLLPSGPLHSERSWRAGRMQAEGARDEDVRSAMYPTTSEWCSMQQELVDRGDFDGASMHEDVFSTESPDSTPQLCEDVRRLGTGPARGLRARPPVPSGPASRLRDVSCAGRVEGGAGRFALSYGPTAAVRQNSSSGYYRSNGPPGSSGGRTASKVGGLGPERRSSSAGPRGYAADTVRDVDSGTAGAVKQLKHMFETTRMSRIGTFATPTRVHHMVQRYEGGDARAD
eukprot:jgi/Ulvmu1/10647/UM066_0027.1